MNSEDVKIRSKYNDMNKMSQKGKVVFFGSDMFYALPVSELSEHFDVNEFIYNRSIPGKSVYDMRKMIDVCALDLDPGRVFLNFGEVDIKDNDFDFDKFISEYEWILYTLRIKTDAKIYVVSVVSDDEKTEELNRRIKKLSSENKCPFIDISEVSVSQNPQYRIFDILKYYIRYRKINFAEAMSAVNYK